MIIGVDARPLIKKKSGIGIYIEKILHRLLEMDSKNQYYLFSDTEIFFESKSENIHKCIYNKGIILPGTIYFELFLRNYMNKNKIFCDVFWGTQQFVPLGLPKSCKIVLTIHDLAYKIFPETMDNKLLFMLNMFACASIKRADRIVCVSLYTKNMLQKYYGKYITNKDCRVIYISGSLDEEDAITDNKSVEKYLLFIGNIEPRKNIQVLLEAYQKCRRKIDVGLVICGKMGWKSKELQERIQKDSTIKYLDYVSEEKKKELLENAFALVLPSKYEGFGIPAVEAMQCGTIAIIADNSSMKEIVEPSALRFETMNADDLEQKICDLYNNSSLYDKMQNYCADRGKMFSWKITGQQIYNALCDWENKV